MKHLYLLVILFNLISRPLLAQDLNFKLPTMSGSGCPVGSQDIVLTPDRKTISILFDEFSVEVPQYNNDNDNDVDSDFTQHLPRLSKLRNNPALSHKICNITLDALIPEATKVDSIDVSVDFRGLASLDPGVLAAFRSIFVKHNGLGSTPIIRDPRRVINRGGFTRSKVIVDSKIWAKHQITIDEDWFISKTINIPIKSSCASSQDREIQFQLQNMIAARMTPEATSSAGMGLLSVDTADLKAKINVKLNLVRCPRVNRPVRPTRPVRDISKPRRPVRPVQPNPRQPRPRKPVRSPWHR